ncbi:MAG: 1,3,6,8-tetrahydroxynaphthalene synthase [Alphaproteobacteria bacterium MarineAlpha2_Bin1]|nr:MAG: 1,3,6,8-tetrahydroxynaphthalene synthase [Alphaproteobacteria bacterium MarineAlpha2_Bin1]
MKENVYIKSLTTATPDNIIYQNQVLPAAASHFSSKNPSFKRLMKVYMNSSIETRFSSVPLEWYTKKHSFSERNSLYLKYGLELLEKVSLDAINKANLNTNDIDGIVTVSSSGIATPSLDALLIEKLKFKRNTIRMPIFGLGCVGGVVGLSRASDIAIANKGKNILFVVLELCGLTFRHNDFSKSNIVATALFADGAAAAILNTNQAEYSITASGEYTWEKSLDVMGWDVKDDGLAVVFSKDIPTLVKNNFKNALDDFLITNKIKFRDINNFVCHPGGVKVIEALEEIFEIKHGALNISRDILKKFGNMSAATVLFVLEKSLSLNKKGKYLVTSLGPGFSAGFLIIEK